jgi:plastocyanin
MRRTLSPRIESPRAESLRVAVTVFLAMTVTGGFALNVFAASREAVSQQERIFHPNRLEITRGDTVGVLNDDGELLHHAYVATDDFNFDSGEQQPGSTTDIRFTKAGTFTVRCRIHPKMALVVTVK